jgi:hypothetical protein
MLRKSLAVLVVGGVAIAFALAGDSSGSKPDASTEHRLVATGHDSRVGDWEIFAFDSPALEDRGETLQPAGLPCLELVLSDGSGQPVAGRGFCGERGRVPAAGLLVENRAGRQFHVLFGRALQEATAVELATPGKTRVSVVKSPADPGAGLWALVVPRETGVRTASLDWVRGDDSPAGEPIDMTLQLTRPGDPVSVP